MSDGAPIARFAIIGRGMFGAAAARHLSARHDGVVVVGPDEPVDPANHDGVFASHYDEGRMTRYADADATWALTAARSIERYAEIERASGIPFHAPVGYLGIGPAGDGTLARAGDEAAALGAPVERMDGACAMARFPALDLPCDAAILHEGGRAGFVSPRAFVEAQSAIAVAHGARLVRAAATGLRVTASGVEIGTDAGETLRADRVLVAAGAFTEACGLTPTPLHLEVFGRTVVLAKVEGALLDAHRSLPTMGHVESGAYILPPIRYPDGYHWLKLGIGSPTDPELRSLDALRAWFRGDGSAANLRDFPPFVTRLIPALANCETWRAATCVVARTASGLPVIDFVHGDRIAVAVGGNGKGAKSADEWGRLAALLVAGEPWESTVSRDALRAPR